MLYAVLVGLLLVLLLAVGLCLYAVRRLAEAVESLGRRVEALERRSRLNGRHAALTLALWGACAGAGRAQQPLSPADAVAMAAADARALPAGVREYTRYVTLFAVPEPKRPMWVRILGFHCNQLSTEADIVLPATVPGTQGSLLRINVLDYGWEKVWEKLEDPLFHVKIQKQEVVVADDWQPWPGGVWPKDGRFYPRGSFQYRPQRTAQTKPPAAKKETALAPWLPAREAAELVNLTQSAAPVVRGDWFLWQTAQQADRVPGYYDFIGVKDKKSFDALVGYDEKLQKASKRVELLEAVAVSTVTLQPRRIGAFPAISGTYYQTFDSRLAVEEKNPLRILNGGFKFEAQEVFGHAANGMLLWGLFDDKGARQDAAPDFIASDSTAHSTDRRVHSAVSCIRCHLPNAGINPVDGWARNLFQGPLKLQSPDYEKLKDLRQKYLRDLEGPMEDSRRTYARAIAQATGGMKPAEVGQLYGLFFAEYDGPVTLERAARDAGLSPERFQVALRDYVVRAGSVDTVAAAFLGAKKGGIPVTSYHEILPAIQTALRGYVLP